MSVLNVVGMGYIGLPTAIMFASSGIKVVGTDINAQYIEKLSSRRAPFKEVGLNALFQQISEDRLSFSNEYLRTDKYLIAVPTPYIHTTKKLDPTNVISAVNSVLDVCKQGSILIIESTVSPGSIDKYIRPEITKRGLSIGMDVHLVHAPERITPGKMLLELKGNSRTIGVDDLRIGEIVKQLYKSFCTGEIVLTNIKTAEMTKVVENTYRDINIAFANELAKICREDNMDVYEIIRIANKHPRVNILQPGPGVGGHCISVDPWFLVGDYPDLTNLILTARKVNNSMPEFVLRRMRDIMHLNKLRSLDKVGLYGLTYKENVDDVRESPTLQLLDVMDKHLAYGVKVFDPLVNQEIIEGQYFDFDKFLNDIEFIVVMVGHDHLQNNISNIGNKIILDTRDICKIEGVFRL